MSPRAKREAPVHRQISDWFTERIVAGKEGFRPGDQLPTIRDTAAEWKVGQQAAQRAYELLASSKLVEMRGRAGTFVTEPRNVLGPQQRVRSGELSEAERVLVRSAALVPAAGAYAYIRPILGLGPSIPPPRVIRREWQTLDSTGPFMLTVSWVPGIYASQVPELLECWERA